MEIRIDTIDALPQAARDFVTAIGSRRVFAFYGKMGAGKTTLIRAIANVIGVEEPVTSPSFAIVNEYGLRPADGAYPYGKSLYHFDFYRINNPQELYDIGCDDYFYSGNLCFIEWPEIAAPLLPPDTIRVDITVEGDARLIRLA